MLSSKGSKPAGFIVSFVAFDGPLRPIAIWRGQENLRKKTCSWLEPTRRAR